MLDNTDYMLCRINMEALVLLDKEKWDLELVAGGKMGILSFRKASTVKWSQSASSPLPSAFPVQ